ncbi:regulator of chromosome condensation 1/beta-lactamase-inhibitor protein II [Scleroderma yunnanense]
MLSIKLREAGSNARGQLGIGSSDDAHTFTPCVFNGHGPRIPPNTDRIISLASGANHTVVLLQLRDGEVQLWGAGDGSKGQLGPERAVRTKATVEDSMLMFMQLAPPFSKLFQKKGLFTCRLVAAAWETTYIVFSCPGKSDILVSMGSNDFGALGIAASTSTPTNPRIINLSTVLGDKAGATCSSNISIKSIHAGPRHVILELYVYTADGTSSSHILVGWGASRHGQLGQKSRTPCIDRPTVIPVDIQSDPLRSCSLGNEHTVILHQSNRISTLGSNRKGQLESLSSVRMHIEEIGCTWNGTYMRAREGGQNVLFATGSNTKGQLGRCNTTATGMNIIGAVEFPEGPTMHITKFACGSEHVLALTSQPGDENNISNCVWGWGWNEHGNLGLGLLEDIPRPAQLWPRNNMSTVEKVVDIWAACGNSWLALSSIGT